MGFGGEVPKILQYLSKISEILLNHHRNTTYCLLLIFQKFGGGNTDWWGNNAPGPNNSYGPVSDAYAEIEYYNYRRKKS